MRVDAATNQYAGYAALSSSRAAPGIRARAEQVAPGRPASEAPHRGAARPEQTAGPRRVVELTAEEQRLIQTLRNRDREVRAHELAHQSVGGPYASSASFEHQTGPDGRRYAVSGEVDVDLRRTGDPEQDLRMAETVRRAALAPAEPSAQDQRIAARAAAIAAEARQTMASEEAPPVSGGAGAATENRAESPKRPVEGEYIDRVSSRRRESTAEAVSPFARQFAAVQQMGGAEFMARGGRLDLFA